MVALRSRRQTDVAAELRNPDRPVLEATGPMMLEHNVKPGFRIDLHTTSSTLWTPHATAHGHSKDDHSGLVQHYEALAGARLGD